MTDVFKNMNSEEAKLFMNGNSHPIREFVANKVNGRLFLDLGCGKGIKIKNLYTPQKYYGLDCSIELIKIAKKDNPNYFFYHLDILSFLKNQTDKQISLGIMISVLEHVESLEIAQSILNEARRVCQILYLGWHHPPYYKETKIIKIKAELNNLMYQNHYKEGSFGNPSSVEKIKFAELWTFTD